MTKSSKGGKEVSVYAKNENQDGDVLACSSAPPRPFVSNASFLAGAPPAIGQRARDNARPVRAPCCARVQFFKPCFCSELPPVNSYSYPKFHIAFCFASCFVAMQLSSWLE